MTTTATIKPSATFYDLTLSYSNTDPTNIFGEWRGRIWDGSNVASTTSFMRFGFRISRIGAAVSCGVGTMELADSDSPPYVNNIALQSSSTTAAVIRITLYSAASATGILTQGTLMLHEHNNVLSAAQWA